MCDDSGLLIWGPIDESRRNEGVGESEREKLWLMGKMFNIIKSDNWQNRRIKLKWTKLLNETHNLNG